jgi:hypothetical protein
MRRGSEAEKQGGAPLASAAPLASRIRGIFELEDRFIVVLF